jgi:CelD/BcsL family acetyltransferase involved in cellulose biosynthesis
MTLTEAIPAGGISEQSPLEQTRVHGTWIHTRAEFQNLRDEWTALHNRSGSENAFLSFEWMFTWWQHWGDARRLAIIAVRNPAGRLVGLAPFSIARSWPAGLGPRWLCFIADSHVGSDYLTILAEAPYEQAVVDEIVRLVLWHCRDWDYIELADAEDAPAFTTLCMQLETAGLLRQQSAASICYRIPLPPTFDEYLARLSTSLRCNFRRRWRAIQKQEKVEFLTLENEAELEQYFPDLLRLHRMRFENAMRDSAFLAPGVPAFHRDALKALARSHRARLFLLRVNGEAIGAVYGFSLGKSFQFYQCGMHPDWRGAGVGQMMIGASIEQVVLAGHVDFDFLRGSESYKAGWAKDQRSTITVRLFGRRPFGLFALALYTAKAALTRGKARIGNPLSRITAPVSALSRRIRRK